MEKHLADYVQTGDVPNWMIESWRLLIQKDARKRNAAAIRNRKFVDEGLEEQKSSS